MSAANKSALEPIFVRTAVFYSLIGQKLAQRAERAGWIRPRQRRHNWTIWATEDVQRVQQRLLRGEYPPPLPSERKRKEEGL